MKLYKSGRAAARANASSNVSASAPRSRCFLRGRRSAGRSSLGCRTAALARQRRLRYGAARLALERARGGARTRPRRRVGSLSCRRILFRLAACGWRRRFLHRRFYARPTRFGQSDRDRLFGRARAVLALADVIDLLPHKFPGLRARRFSRAAILCNAFESGFIGHDQFTFRFCAMAR